MRSSPEFPTRPDTRPETRPEPAAQRSRLKSAVRSALGLLAPGLAGWGGYGLGVAAAADLSAARTLAAAGLLAGGAACALPGLRRAAAGRGGRPAAHLSAPGSFAGDAATLESLAPAAAAHPDGLACLRTLADLLFQARHAAPATSPTAAATADRAAGETAVREGGAR